VTGYVVLPPGHVAMACLQVLPSEVPEDKGNDVFKQKEIEQLSLPLVRSTRRKKNRSPFINMDLRSCFFFQTEKETGIIVTSVT